MHHYQLADWISYRRLLWVDVALCVVILSVTPYTEVDWIAYMQEVEGFLEGETNYVNLKGDTGPLVYPGVFVYLYAALYYVTARGTMVWLAQWLFTAAYVCVTALTFHLYGIAGRVPMLFSIMAIMSRRMHSIFLLRLFNDGIAMLLLYTATVSTAWRDWKQGALWFSLAVGVKMNVLLFAPGFLAVWCRTSTTSAVVGCLAICAAVQLGAGLPFLSHYPVAYIGKAFELSRVFTYKWTVNYKFLDEETFASPSFGLALLASTLLSWMYLAIFRWRKRDMSHPGAIIRTLFESNLVGVVFSRTMHYQFYVWMFHQIPLLLYYTAVEHRPRAASEQQRRSTDYFPVLQAALSIGIAAGIEYGFTTYPSSPFSSAILMSCLAILWARIMTSSEQV